MLAFDCLPSNLQEVYWSFTLEDLKVKLRLYVGERQASILQEFQSLSLVAAQAVGGNSKGSKSNSNHDVVVPKTAQEMQGAFMSVFGNGH